MGMVAWFGMLTLAGLGLIFLLPFRPGAVALLAIAGSLAAVLLQR